MEHKILMQGMLYFGAKHGNQLFFHFIWSVLTMNNNVKSCETLKWHTCYFK